MLSSFVERIADCSRPFRVPGKGRLFTRWIPWTGKRDVVLFGKYPRTLDLANGQQRQMFMGCFATGVERYFRPLLSSGDTFVDVGANIGYFSLLAASLVGAAGRVISFEPNPVVFAELDGWIRENRIDWVRPLCAAVSDAEGVLKLYVPPQSAHKDFNVSIVPIEGAVATDVPAHRLDDLLDREQARTIQLMKVDVEGSEPKVFAGAPSLASGRVRHLICELNAYYLKELGTSPAELVDQIRKLGFVPARLSHGQAFPSERELHIPTEGDEDAFFVHKSAIATPGRSRG